MKQPTLLMSPCYRDYPLKFSMAEKKLGFFESFMLSGAAAGVSKTAAAPIERVKLLVQNQGEMIKQVQRVQENMTKINAS